MIMFNNEINGVVKVMLVTEVSHLWCFTIFVSLYIAIYLFFRNPLMQKGQGFSNGCKETSL